MLSGETFDRRYLKRTFELSAPATYTTYRLEITKNDLDVEMTQIAEIELLGCDATPTGPVAVTGVELSPTSLQMEPGATLQLLANLSPSNATDKGVSWSSQDGAIATVDGNGNVTAIAPGSTTVTVTTDDGGFTASATVQVQDPGTGGDCNGQLSDVTEPVGSGTITSRNDFVPAEDRYKAFDNRSVRGDHSKWLDAGGVPTTASPSWIQIVLQEPRRVEQITITSANDDYGRDPMDFRLMASNGGTFELVGSLIRRDLRPEVPEKDLRAVGAGNLHDLQAGDHKERPRRGNDTDRRDRTARVRRRITLNWANRKNRYSKKGAEQ
ncbi:Ig-like domain-containing protein [Maribacter litopenaei]|uniref:Ig-like domain-containing protein n=1 Tax=Maribacter litopenaei TaxID=2976127 RepID=A0ABY5YB37_9FLAO|nr:Ig-like domain-containing protein [Maribacter litopenaei]UWX56088.1 Ig-like domain-containing protein [Maribacter litopenaei]